MGHPVCLVVLVLAGIELGLNAKQMSEQRLAWIYSFSGICANLGYKIRSTNAHKRRKTKY